MLLLLKKLRRHCAGPQDFFSLLCVLVQARWSVLWGTCALRCKAALFGVECAGRVRAMGGIILSRWPRSRISIGEGVQLVSCPRRATAASSALRLRLKTLGPDAEIILEKGVELTAVSISARSKRIHIGAYTMIAPGCVLVDSDFHALWPAESRHLEPGYEGDAPIDIADHVWIGMNCCILKGVSIGRGSIVAAGSVVTRSVPPNCLVAGVPARLVKRLDEADGQAS